MYNMHMYSMCMHTCSARTTEKKPVEGRMRLVLLAQAQPPSVAAQSVPSARWKRWSDSRKTERVRSERVRFLCTRDMCRKKEATERSEAGVTRPMARCSGGSLRCVVSN